MPAQELAFRDQKAVLWPKVGVSRNGQPKVGSAVSIDVRWNVKQHQTLDPHGNVVPADVLMVVDQDILVGSVVWLGDLLSLDTTEIPPDTVYEVIAFNSTPDVKGREYFRTASLMRYMGVLPTVVSDAQH